MQSMEIKNLKTGNLIRFGGEHFKRLVKLQETTEVKYFTKRDLAECVSAVKKTKTKTQPKIKKLGTNSKRIQKGGDIITEDTVRYFDQSKTECALCGLEYDDKYRIPFQIDECKHELCTKCAGRWFVHQNQDWCPMCREPKINVRRLKQQIGPLAAMPVNYETVLSAILIFPANAEMKKNNFKKVEAYIEQGGDVDAKDLQNRTLLHWACAEGKTQVVKLLVEKGADVNAITARGDTPLDLARIRKQHEIVDFLTNRTRGGGKFSEKKKKNI
jgi:hypothetical protein